MTSRVRSCLLVSLLLAPGCKDEPAPPASTDAGGVAFSPPAPPPATEGSPPSQSALGTTDGTIAAGNMLGQLRSYESAVERNPRAIDFMSGVIELSSARAQFFGQLDGYDRAYEMADKLVATEPKNARVYVARASTRAALHQFADAEADLARGEKLGTLGARAPSLRASILQAEGKLADALAIRHAESARQGDLVNLGAEAALLGEMGRTDEAEKMFIEAQHHFRDVAPFPVAWLYFQEGLMWERAGNSARARELYEAAVSRLPDFAPATGHLAGLLAATGDRARAVELLRALVEKSNDPEYQGQLAGLLRAEGHTADADLLRDKAKARYDDLLKKHPAAFGDHAARFFLAEGADPARALALAQANVKLRQSGEAYDLLMEAAVAAKAGPVGCDAAEKALAACAPPTVCSAHRHVLASRAFDGCGKKDRAEAELKAAREEKVR
jgi:tetratricopeptide (TPR) repeat protein